MQCSCSRSQVKYYFELDSNSIWLDFLSYGCGVLTLVEVQYNMGGTLFVPIRAYPYTVSLSDHACTQTQTQNAQWSPWESKPESSRPLFFWLNIRWTSVMSCRRLFYFWFINVLFSYWLFVCFCDNTRY